MSDSWLAGPVTSTAFGWRLERADGVTLGFTTHDCGLEVRGALTSSAICADDLASGRWDAARLELFLFDWSDPDAGKRILTVGELGAVSYAGEAFEAELLGLTHLLDHPVVPQTSPGCRASFCDADCGLNRLRFQQIREVSLAGDENIELTTPISAGNFAYGSVRFISGANTGLMADVVANGADDLTLARASHYPVTAGTLVELTEGCDKRLETCGGRFGNALNFRGEPHLPGNDLLTRYPGGG
jgi:uncharacterized phage protein (TIGR02218 family)